MEKENKKFKQMEKLTKVDWEKFKRNPYPKKKEQEDGSYENES